MLILSNVMNRTSKFSVLSNDLRVQSEMKIKNLRNQKSAREADLIMGASLIKLTDPGVPGGKTYSPECQLVSPMPYLLPAFL